MQRGVTGSGREYYKRDRALNRGEVDIFVDSRVPVLQEVLKWAEKVTGDCRVIYFETGDKDYFSEIKRVMGIFGFTLIGNPPGYKQAATVGGLLEARPELRPVVNVEERELAQLVPRLIYYNTTAQSVNAAYTTSIRGGSEEADPTRVCVVVDKHSGMEALDYLKEESGNQLSVICPAMIYDDLLRQVRVWIRLGESTLKKHHQSIAIPHTVGSASSSPVFSVAGYNPEAIQAELDTQIAEVLDRSHKSHVKIKPQIVESEGKSAITINGAGVVRQGGSVDEGLSEALDQMSQDLEADKRAAAEKMKSTSPSVEKNSSDIPCQNPGRDPDNA